MKNEKGDCAVRAIASATDSTYEMAHDYASKIFKRKPRRGVKGFSGIMKIREGLNFLNNTRYEEVRVGYRKITVKDFLKHNKNGTYIVVVSGHTFTIKNSEIIGNPDDSIKLNRKIHIAFKII